MTPLRRAARALLVAACALFGLGCLSKNPPLHVRTFEPAHAEIDRQTGGPPLRLVRVDSLPRVRDERMAWRVSPVELAFDDAHRWTVEPASLAAESLERILFDSGAFTPDAEAGVQLTVTLVEFEGDRDARVARVRWRAHLEHPGRAPRQRTFIETFALPSGDAEGLARAMGRALDESSRAIAAWIAATP